MASILKSLLLGIFIFTPLVGNANDNFQLLETSIDDIHSAMRSRKLTCHSLVEHYLARIDAYDKSGPGINAILYINPNALKEADEMDVVFKKTNHMNALHCIPLVIKDNYNTADMPTTAGSSSLAGSRPDKDAFALNKLRQSGALVIAKANLQEFALGGVSISSLGGQVKNPYDLTLTPGGSSGGTAAALAANFATIGIGSDTANSVRSPASANDLVGIRPTLGLISRTGIVPVSFTQDEAGPITRSVRDSALMLDIMTGYDPNDPITALAVGNIPKTYTSALKANALKGARIGVLKTLFGTKPENQEVNAAMERAIEVMKKQGAQIIVINDPELDTDLLNAKLDVQKYEFKSSINAYLKNLGDKAPVHSLDEIISSGKFHPSLEKFLLSAQSYEDGLAEQDYKDRIVKIQELKVRLSNLMAQSNLDALIYPHQKRLPVPIGDNNQSGRNGLLTSLTGYPSIVVPAGFSSATATAPIGVPIGMEIVGTPWSESKLIGYAYAFEQATHFRIPPKSTPDLK